MKSIDLPTTNRYLNALNTLTHSQHFGVFARSTQRELTDTGVRIAEYIAPIATLPINQLTTEERQWRYVAENLSPCFTASMHSPLRSS